MEMLYQLGALEWQGCKYLISINQIQHSMSMEVLLQEKEYSKEMSENHRTSNMYIHMRQKYQSVNLCICMTASFSVNRNVSFEPPFLKWIF